MSDPARQAEHPTGSTGRPVPAAGLVAVGASPAPRPGSRRRPLRPAAASRNLGIIFGLWCVALFGCRGPENRWAPEAGSLVSTGAPLLAGVGRCELTPRRPVPLAGYGARRGRLMTGWHDPLFARALVLQSGSLRVAIVACDLLLIPAELTRVVRLGLRDIGIDGLILTATHTHSGPGAYWDNTLAELTALGPFRPARLEAITEAIGTALAEGVASLAGARLGIATIDAGDLAHNRRVRGGDYDPTLTLVHVEGDDGKPLAALVHFAAHPTILGADNLLVSADFPGPLCSKLEEEGYRVALFVNGAAGEAATAWPGPERGMERVAAVGAALADRAKQARRSVRPESRVRLGWRHETVRLPPVNSTGPAGATWRWILDPIARLYCPSTTAMSVIEIGDWSLLSMPCDLGISTARRIRQGVPSRRVLCLSYANDYIGYVTHADAFDRNTYEARVSFYGPGLADYLEHQACHLLTRAP